MEIGAALSVVTTSSSFCWHEGLLLREACGGEHMADGTQVNAYTTKTLRAILPRPLNRAQRTLFDLINWQLFGGTRTAGNAVRPYQSPVRQRGCGCDEWLGARRAATTMCSPTRVYTLCVVNVDSVRGNARVYAGQFRPTAPVLVMLTVSRLIVGCHFHKISLRRTRESQARQTPKLRVMASQRCEDPARSLSHARTHWRGSVS